MILALSLFLCIYATAYEVETTYVSELIDRVTNSKDISKKIGLEIIPFEKDQKDIFVIERTTERDTILLKGTSNNMLTLAFNMYLKYYCNNTVSWGNGRDGYNIRIPDPLPEVKTTWTQKMNDNLRYYMNVCTFGYSYVWYDWEQWEQEIDWMALSGINLPLAFTGQEYVFGEVYADIGLSEEEIEDHFTGIAFLPWNRMGNIHGWGGPLTKKERLNEYLLNKKIVEREMRLGMKPVMPAFNGYVPKAILKIYPNVSYSVSPLWAGFNSTYSNIILIEPSDPVFKELATLFIKKQLYPA